MITVEKKAPPKISKPGGDGSGNPYHDPKNGRFTSRGGGSAAGDKEKPTKTGAEKPTKSSMPESAAAKLRAELEAQPGAMRDKEKRKVADAYHRDVALVDKFYKRDTSDGGARPSGVWDKSEKPPAGYPKEWPKAPRDAAVKQGDFTSKSVYKPPMSMAEIDGLRDKGPAGVYAARVIMHELYAHAKQRQGPEVAQHKFESAGQKKYMAANKISSVNWEWHHKIPGGKGGSDDGSNMALINGGEHTVAHMLEAVITPTKGAGGKGTKPGNLGVYKTVELATAARAQNNITKQLGSQAGKLRNAKYGKMRAPALSSADFAKIEEKITKQAQKYINIAVKAGAWKKGSKKIKFDQKGVVFDKPAVTSIRDYLLNNPIEPGQI
jgi:hypothetical protein